MKLYLFVSVQRSGKSIIKESAISIELPGTLADLFLEATSFPELPPVNIQVCFQTHGSLKWHDIKMGIEEDLNLLVCLQAYRIQFSFDDSNDSIVPSSPNKNIPNTLETLMQNSKKLQLPPAKSCTLRTDLLYNHLLDMLREKRLGWTGGLHLSVGKDFVKRLTNLIWYIDPHRNKFTRRSFHMPLFVQQLPEYQKDRTYNIYYEESHHKKWEISSEKLHQHIGSVKISIVQPWALELRWESFQEEVIQLCEACENYIKYLKQVNSRMRILHDSSIPIRNGIDHIKVEDLPICENVNSKYQPIVDILNTVEVFEPICINEYLPADSLRRPAFLKEMSLPLPTTSYIYYHGNYLGNLHWIWKKDEEINDYTKTLEAQAILKIYNEIPKYSTRQMRKNVTSKYSLFTKLSPSVIREIYQDITGDAVASNDTISEEMRKRIKLVLQTKDPDIIYDLRVNNGFQGTKFNDFWDAMQEYFNDVLPAVHERRTKQIMYMPIAISVRDLREAVIEILKNKYDQETFEKINIPSVEWIRLQFQPKNQYAKSAIQYTGRFNIEYKVQSRLLRKSHLDSYYCAALFKYERQFAVKFRNHTAFICADDKHKIGIGDDTPVSTGVRNKATLSSTEVELSASDHDFTKCSLTPSVSLFVKIPKNISESFYDGNVYASYKDSIFEPSSALRHSLEWLQALEEQYIILPEILLIYTDGGPDHRCTFGSVQIALICLFLHGDFDFLAAVRTAPYQSWTNPAERIMSILNLGLQGVAIQRDKLSPEMENLMGNLKTMEDIREAAKQIPNLKPELKASIQNIQKMLDKRTERLILHETRFKTMSPAIEYKVDEFFNILNEQIDNSVSINDTTQNKLRQCADLQRFIKTHCISREYSFQIKKCGKPECEFCSPARLPPDVFKEIYWIPDPQKSSDSDHFQDFNSLYGRNTTEDDRPSKQSRKNKKEYAPQGMLITSRIRDFIWCKSCKKPRCIFSKSALTEKEQEDLEISFEQYDYTCGSKLLPETHPLYNIVFVKVNLTCESQIEQLYYTSKVAHKDICIFCGEDDLAEKPENLVQEWAFVYAMCKVCEANGRKWECKIKRQAKKKRRIVNT